MVLQDIIFYDVCHVFQINGKNNTGMALKPGPGIHQKAWNLGSVNHSNLYIEVVILNKNQTMKVHLL